MKQKHLYRSRRIVRIVCLVLITLFSACAADAPATSVTINVTTAEAPSVAQNESTWQPQVGASWQWQLGDADIDSGYAVDVYDIDLFDTDAAVVEELHAQGKKVICYISVGSWEAWRPDAGRFPAEVIGRDYTGWPDEKWLDIRRIDLLEPVIAERIALCAQKGFDGVEPDNIDGYANNTGFPLTETDQLAFDIWVANTAHENGLVVGLKNAPELLPDLLPYFDFAISEDCFDQGWCAEMQPFITAGKAVFAAEYTDNQIDFAAFCAQSDRLQISPILKNRRLDSWVAFCP
jgi:hypothetical protein